MNRPVVEPPCQQCRTLELCANTSRVPNPRPTSPPHPSQHVGLLDAHVTCTDYLEAYRTAASWIRMRSYGMLRGE